MRNKKFRSHLYGIKTLFRYLINLEILSNHIYTEYMLLDNFVAFEN